MKKIVVLLLIAFSLGIIMTSCQSNRKCAAYGEADRFKVERSR